MASSEEFPKERPPPWPVTRWCARWAERDHPGGGYGGVSWLLRGVRPLPGFERLGDPGRSGPAKEERGLLPLGDRTPFRRGDGAPIPTGRGPKWAAASARIPGGSVPTFEKQPR